jgi:hypothetical protein
MKMFELSQKMWTSGSCGTRAIILDFLAGCLLDARNPKTVFAHSV